MKWTSADGWARAAAEAEVRDRGPLVTHVNGHTIALFYADGNVYAVDNRCPHMGFPLHRGTVKDCVLTCHWHHARFDLTSGGTFDPWADDVRSFPVEIRSGEVWVDVAPRSDARTEARDRLRDGLERGLSLVIGKSVIRLLDDGDPVDPFRIGLDFGTHNRRMGWGQGLTIHACMMNLIPVLDPQDRPRALYHGLSAVAADSFGSAPRFMLRPLPDSGADFPTLKRWFRRFVEVRDSEGAERCILTAVRQGADHRQMADMLFAAVTDHRYIDTGHRLDFTNKALEALDLAGWDLAEPTLTSLATGYATAERMEESNSWRNPVDLIPVLESAFELIPAALEEGSGISWAGRDSLVPILLGDDPVAIADSLLDALREGCGPEELAGTVTYAATLRIARFHTSNEFGDWDRALHTFTFANAVHQGLRRVASVELIRGVFDAAMSVYLDRFLNIPPARIPDPAGKSSPDALLAELPELLNRQQQVNEAGGLVAEYLAGRGATAPLLARLGQALLREDRDFHTIQMVEAAFGQHALAQTEKDGAVALIAALRYLAAHSPTVRAQGQTFQIAQRLHGGERLYEDS